MSYIAPKPYWAKSTSGSEERRAVRGPDQHRHPHVGNTDSGHRKARRDVDSQASLPPLPVISCVEQTVHCAVQDRLETILKENGLDAAMIWPIWREPWPDVKLHLFDPVTGLPRFMVTIDVWKPVIRAYFSWYNIPREQCTHIWADIVDQLLRLPPTQSGDADFRAWAYGCLCKFYLEDNKLAVRGNPSPRPQVPAGSTSAEYDPSTNWKI